jgi:hypothetical protein
MKLNIGDGGIEHPDYAGLDIRRGQDAAVLVRPDSSIDEIRASHVLEHFPHGQVLSVLKEWVRALRPGGLLKIAVPDFRMIAEQYLAGAELPTQGYVMGGQVDAHDFHKTLFDEELLTEALKAAGLIGIRRWQDDIDDCSRLPISLNLCGTKPYIEWPKCAAVISMPRLGFNDFWDCAVSYLKAFMPVRRITGAYWDANLIQAIEESLDLYDPEWILTADYDGVFLADQIMALLDLAVRHPEADAIAPIQTARWHDRPMLTVKGPDGSPMKAMRREDLQAELLPSESAHFGLTLLRASKLKTLPQPWMQRRFGKEQCDPDVDFWHNWKAAGYTLFTALRIPIGHCELMVRWPDMNLEAIHQKPAEFFKSGPPENVWR